MSTDRAGTITIMARADRRLSDINWRDPARCGVVCEMLEEAMIQATRSGVAAKRVEGKTESGSRAKT